MQISPKCPHINILFIIYMLTLMKALCFHFVRCLASALTHHRPVPLLTAGSCLSVSQVRVFSPDGSGLLNTRLEELHSHHNYSNQTHLPNALCNYALFGCVTMVTLSASVGTVSADYSKR